MTRRFRRMRLALDLNRFYVSERDRDRSEDWGVRLYTFHAPGSIMHFSKLEQIREKAIKVARSSNGSK